MGRAQWPMLIPKCVRLPVESNKHRSNPKSISRRRHRSQRSLPGSSTRSLLSGDGLKPVQFRGNEPIATLHVRLPEAGATSGTNGWLDTAPSNRFHKYGDVFPPPGEAQVGSEWGCRICHLQFFNCDWPFDGLEPAWIQ